MATTRANKNISQFKSKLIGGGARPNLFEVELTTLPPSVVADWDAEIFTFMCKGANLPEQSIANIDVPFRGRIFKVAGDRTIAPWTITVINDEDFRFRNAFENWTQQIANLDDNLGTTDPNAYMVNAKVYQLGRGSEKSSQNSGGDSNVVLKEYEFIDIFPTNVSAIDLSYDTGDTIEEFTVEFQVQSLRLTGAGRPN
tara:strand:+ start:66 stop:659 length:594 start_codon:yes stop_codon:yes gene_type:complete